MLRTERKRAKRLTEIALGVTVLAGILCEMCIRDSRTTALQKEDTPYSFSVPSKENATILRLPRLPDTGVSVQPSGGGYPVVIVLHLR